jgi:hypothetical protein
MPLCADAVQPEDGTRTVKVLVDWTYTLLTPGWTSVGRQRSIAVVDRACQNRVCRVLSNFVCPSSNCTARRFFVR